jgi:hypothetical protein
VNLEQAASESMSQEEVRAPVRQLVRVGRSDVDLRRELSDVFSRAYQTREHRVLADKVGSKKTDEGLVAQAGNRAEVVAHARSAPRPASVSV